MREISLEWARLDTSRSLTVLASGLEIDESIVEIRGCTEPGHDG